MKRASRLDTSHIPSTPATTRKETTMVIQKIGRFAALALAGLTAAVTPLASLSAHAATLPPTSSAASTTVAVGSEAHIPAPKGATLPSTVTRDTAAPGDFVWPATGTITQNAAGHHSSEGNYAQDIANTSGTPVYAAHAGTVVFAGTTSNTYKCYDRSTNSYRITIGYGFGNFVVIRHDGGPTTYYTLYGHFSSVSVQAGQAVTTDTQIGLMGSTGCSSGPHTHFEIGTCLYNVIVSSPCTLWRAADPAVWTHVTRGTATGGSYPGLGGGVITPPTPTPTPAVSFISHAYKDMLGRPAEDAAISGWAQQFAQGAPRSAAATMIAQSQEFRTRIVSSYYTAFLHRPADTGVAGWVAGIAHGATFEQAEADIIGSDEYFATRAGNNLNTFFDTMYADVLNHPVDSGARAWLQNLIAGGKTRADVALIVIASPEGLADRVQTVYQTYLHRAAESAAVSANAQALARGMRDEQLISTVVGSDEYYSNILASYVNHVYTDMLGRPAEPAAIQAWTRTLKGGAPLSSLPAMVAGSLEFRLRLVSSYYVSYLHRQADSGASGWTAGIAGGATFEQEKAGVIGSDEYFQTRAHGNLDAFFDALYADVLGRPVDSGARDWLHGQIAAGATRAQVALAIITSAEGWGNDVQSVYQTYLRRGAEPAAVAGNTKALQAGMRDEQLIALVVGSEEYINHC